MLALTDIMEQVATTLTVHIGVPVSPGLRNATDTTPCVVMELVSAEASMQLSGLIGGWQVVMAFHCVASTHALALATADDVVAEFVSGTTTDNFKQQPMACSISSRTETPDDGQADAERIVTATLTWTVMEI